MKKVFCCLVAAGSIALATPPLRAQTRSEKVETRNEKVETLYEQGTDAIDDQEWRAAARDFERVAAIKAAHADAALYWLAYARSKMGMRPEAISALQALKQEYPKSKWNNDAEKLEMEIRQSAGQKIEPEKVGDEDLKLIALNGLIQSDPDRAIPILEEMLQSGKSPKLKDRALFVLSQSSSEKASEILSRAAKNSANPDLQRRALRYIALMGNRSSGLLADMYASTSDVDLKRSILKDYMLTGDHTRLLELAKKEANPELRAEAVQQLGLMGARTELSELYNSETSIDVRKKIIQAMFLGGNSEKLYDIARNEPTLELKLTAIRNLGLLGGEKTAQFLVSLYQTDSRIDVRSSVINSLFLQGNAKALVDLARSEKDPELKKSIIDKLSLMRSKEAVDYLMEFLKN